MATVLIVDDSPAFRRLEGEFLTARGLDLLYAEDGAQAIRVAVAKRPDLIILDIEMPKVSGIQVLTFLKNEKKTKKIPIVIVSSKGRGRDVDRLTQAGAAAVLSKPLRAPDLWRAISSLLPA